MSAKKQKNSKYRFLRRTLRVLLGIIVFVLLVFLFIRSPWGQNIIVDKVTQYISNKTKTKVEIDKAFLTFDGNLKVDGLFLEDKKGDTLIYSKSLEANLPIWGLIKGTSLGVDDVKWNGLRANIIRKDTISGYNFQFLIDALVSENTDTITKNTNTKSPEFVIGSLNLSDINVVYKDVPLGIESSYKIGKLETSFETMDLENMVFEVDDLEISNSNIKYIQKPALIRSTEKAVLPKLSAENISIKNTQLYFKDVENNLLANLDIFDFYTENPQINLEESIFEIDEILLKNSSILVKTANNNLIETSENKRSSEFIWPELSLKIAEVNLENNAINYFVNDSKIDKNVFNPNAIVLSNLTLRGSNIFYDEKRAGLKISTFNFKESSGLDLDELSFDATVSDKNLKVDDLEFSLDKNYVSGNLSMNYYSLSQLINSPENTNVNLNLFSIDLNLNRLKKLKPSLKNNPYILEVSKKPISGKLFAKGKLSKIKLSNSKINWGKSTNIYLNGTITNSTNPELLKINLPNFKAETTRKDITKFIKEDDLGITLPEEILLIGDINGGLNDISTDLKLKSSQGIIAIKADFNNKNQIDYNADVSIENYKINELLKNDQFGEISMNFNSKGKGKSINDLDATLEATISKFQLKNYAIKDLKLKGNFKGGNGKVISEYKDENININLNAIVDLDSVNTDATIDINLIGADLEGLGIMQRKVKTGMDVSVNFKGNLNKYAVDANVKNGAVVYDNRTYLIGPIKAKGYVDKDTTFVSVKNKMIDLNLESNTDPETFANSLQKHVSSYFYRDAAIKDTIKNPVNIKFKAKIAQTNLLEDVFLVNVKDLDTIDIAVDFNEAQRKLDAKITAPHINYSDNELDSLSFTMNTDENNFNFKLGFKEIKANPLNVPRTIITGKQANNELSLNFAGFYKNEQLMNVNTKITGSREQLRFTVNPDSLVLNKSKWTIPEDNEIVFSNNNQLTFTNFKITKDDQSIEITDKFPDISKNHVALEYKNFKISEVFNYLNPEKKIATGILNGNFVLEDPFNNTGIIANLNVSQLKFLKTDFGKLTIDAKSLGNSRYDFTAKLKEGDINLDLIGDYFVENKEANLNLNLDINEFKMNALNTLSLGEIKDTSGSFSGNFKLTGTTSNPNYNGELNFKNADFNITKLNTKFTLKNEKLTVDNEGIYMSKFTVLDAKNNALTLSGKINTESFINPKFDLKLNAKNFRLLNAKKEDNPNLYGLATFNANAELTGDLQIPKLTADVTLGSETNVTYVLPTAYANVENRDEVVVFVNRENPDAILTKTEEKSAIISGFDIFAKLNINKNAAITVVINEETGDNFKVSGDGDFIFNMVPNGKVSLTGTYEIADGHYELNLYNLVNRKFYLQPGSRISWSGDPFDASLDVSAIYNLETAALPLMSAQISDEDPSFKSKFKQVLPFNVYLNIDGELLQPKISFNLDMPEENQGAIGGQVYGRVQQVNQQEEELNKQVFSLLVLNRFYPDSGSDGSSGGFATIARDNLNDAVSGQLNTFSDKILGNSGIELNFDLNSYTDYQGNTPTDRTQLGVTAQKKLFNERLTVRVGSDVDLQGSNTTAEQTPLIGNVSLEYKITEDGRYRIKGFRKSEFENVIDGQTIVSGIALIFTQEFNEFSEMWDAIFRSKSKKEEEEKELSEEEQKKKEEETNKSIEKKKN